MALLKDLGVRSAFRDEIEEILLADIAVKIQLTQTEQDTAVEHYEAIEKWLERDTSPLKGKIVRIYPQGSMAIGSTISSSQDAEEFDIDLVVELALPRDSTPAFVLGVLFEAIRGEPGSQYYDVTELNSRCVTVHYENMHLDLCPAILEERRPPRTSVMFHHNEERGENYRHIRNPWGFAEWFNRSLSEDLEYAEFYVARGVAALRANAEPVPDLVPVYNKPRKVVALQLLKRFRNHRYEQRATRGPPSVILSHLAIESGDSVGGLFYEIELQAKHLERSFSGPLLELRNQACPQDDILTDRWPKDPACQREFYRDVRHLQGRLVALRLASSLREKQAILADLFGERATSDAFERLRRTYDERADQGVIKVDKKTAGISIAASGISTRPMSSPAVISTPRHHSHATAKRM